jgi:hypothetical protein
MHGQSMSIEGQNVDPVLNARSAALESDPLAALVIK